MKDQALSHTGPYCLTPGIAAVLTALALMAAVPVVDGLSTPSAAAVITVLEPGVADSVFALGDSITIRWIYPGGGGSPMEFQISRDSGRTFRKSLSQSHYYTATDTGYVRLTIPNDTAFLTTAAVLLVRDYNRVDNNGASPIFTIRSPSVVRQGLSRSSRAPSSGCAAPVVYTVNGRRVLSLVNAGETAPAVTRVGLSPGFFFRDGPAGAGGLRVPMTGTH